MTITDDIAKRMYLAAYPDDTDRDGEWPAIYDCMRMVAAKGTARLAADELVLLGWGDTDCLVQDARKMLAEIGIVDDMPDTLEAAYAEIRRLRAELEAVSAIRPSGNVSG